MLDCDRCTKPINVCIISEFNDEVICLDCKDEEESHPLYEAARKAKAAMRGELDFGIHLPPEPRER